MPNSPCKLSMQWSLKKWSLSCNNLRLGLATKTKGCKVAGQMGDPGVTSHAPGSAKSVRESTLTFPSELPWWELDSQMDSQNFKERFHGSKLNGLWRFLYHWKALGTWMSKMGLHCSFGHLKHKLWRKERSGVKLAIWLLTTKSRESTRFTYFQRACDILLESFRQNLQLFFRPHLDRRYAHKVMGLRSHRSPNLGDFGTPTWESRDKKSFECGLRGQP
jgi:hypothetical protein